MIGSIAKLMIVVGLVILGVGLLLLVFSKYDIPYLGRLPGDIFIQRKKFIFYFPITTSIILSVVFSLILYFVFKNSK